MYLTFVVCASVQLTDNYAFHVIVLPFDSARRYVSCAEVSALLWDEDVLRTKVAGITVMFSCSIVWHIGLSVVTWHAYLVIVIKVFIDNWFGFVCRWNFFCMLRHCTVLTVVSLRLSSVSLAAVICEHFSAAVLCATV